MKRFLRGLLLAGFAAALMNVMAAEKVPAPGALPPKPPSKTPPTLVKASPLLEDITLQGKLTKEEGLKKTKNGEVKYTKYVLTLADGSQVVVPPPPTPRKGHPGIDIEQFLDKQVTIVGKGHKTQDKVKCTLRSTVSITEEAASEKKEGEAATAAPTATPTPAPAK